MTVIYYQYYLSIHKQTANSVIFIFDIANYSEHIQIKDSKQLGTKEK